MSDVVDLLVVGGGVNGTAIARDGAGRGLRVMLAEQGDLAEGTSSRSSKLVHGGLRYLEYYEFRLVREALKEREVLLRTAPHIVWPMRFVLPHSPLQRPAWLIRLGLFLYDSLGGRERLPASRSLDLVREPEGAPLRDAFTRGFAYSDCWVDDARLVVSNAVDAARRGAVIRTRTSLAAARRDGSCWRAELVDRRSGARNSVQAKAIVNAGGPWVADVVGRTGTNATHHVRLVKGSHVVVRKFWDGLDGFLLQNDDGRVIFVLPYEGDYALIGTTDIPFEGDPATVAISSEETGYLLKAVNGYFKRELRPDDVVHSYAGIRPLQDDAAATSASAVTRDYVFDLAPEAPHPEGAAPLLSVFGGKITTARKLAEHAVDRLGPWFPALTPSWTASSPLPGGDLPRADFETFRAELARRFPGLPERLRVHYGRLYGSIAFDILDGASAPADLGHHWGGDLYERERRHLVANEWALTADDVLWRRTKHGIHLTPAETKAFQASFDALLAA